MSERIRPPQQQDPPGVTEKMDPQPRDSMEDYEGRGLLDGLKALITGGDSGIGRAVAIAFAKEGADVAIAYLNEHEDAEYTADRIRAERRECVLLPGDLAGRAHCQDVVDQTVRLLGGLDILVNNAATQWPVDKPEDLTDEQWLHTFDVNMHSYFRVTAAALPHLREGSVESARLPRRTPRADRSVRGRDGRAPGRSGPGCPGTARAGRRAATPTGPQDPDPVGGSRSGSSGRSSTTKIAAGRGPRPPRSGSTSGRRLSRPVVGTTTL